MKVNGLFKPKTLDEAYHKLTEHSKNVVMAGGAWLRLSNRTVEEAIDLSVLPLSYVKDRGDVVEIGSMTTLHEIETDDTIKSLYGGILSQAVSQIMGIGLRNVVTIGGNVVARHGFSDVITPLLTMRAKLHFYKRGTISLEAFLDIRGKTTDVLEKIIIPKRKAAGYFKKVTKTALDFAIINVSVTCDEEGFSVAVGSRPSVGQLAYEAMGLLNQAKDVDEKHIDLAAFKAADLLKFSDNHRGSQAYREELTAVYVKRGLLAVKTCFNQRSGHDE